MKPLNAWRGRESGRDGELGREGGRESEDGREGVRVGGKQ